MLQLAVKIYLGEVFIYFDRNLIVDQTLLMLDSIHGIWHISRHDLLHLFVMTSFPRVQRKTYNLDYCYFVFRCNHAYSISFGRSGNNY